LILRYLKITLHSFNRNRVKIRNSLIVFFIFLCISTGIWFINALRKNYISALAFPVKFVNFPKDKLSVGELPAYIYLNIKSSGYILLTYRFFHPSSPVEIDMKTYPIYRLSDANPKHYLLTSLVMEDIERQIPNEVKVLDIKPDSIYFLFDKVFTKRVPIVPSVKIDFTKQYSFKDIPGVNPDSIDVFGPKILTDTLQFVKTIPLHLKNINKTTEKSIELQKIYGLSFSVKKVTINVPVEKYTEAFVNIPIETKNVPDSLQLKVLPNFIHLSCRVGLSNYDRIKPYYFKATVDFSDLKDKNLKNLKVQLDEYPRMISNIKYQPQKVDFIIKKK